MAADDARESAVSNKFQARLLGGVAWRHGHHLHQAREARSSLASISLGYVR